MQLPVPNRFIILLLSSLLCSVCGQHSYHQEHAQEDDALILIQKDVEMRRDGQKKLHHRLTSKHTSESNATEQINRVNISESVQLKTSSEASQQSGDESDGNEMFSILMLGTGAVIFMYCLVAHAFEVANSQKDGSTLCLVPSQLGPPQRLPPGVGVVLSPKFLQPNRDFPLGVPISPLTANEWRIDITGSTGAKLLNACLISDSKRRTRNVQIYDTKNKEKPIGAVDSNLNVLDGEGTVIGRLDCNAEHGEYKFCDPNSDSVRNTLRADGEFRTVEFLGGTPSGIRRVMATVTRVNSKTRGDILQVSTIEGTDAVLVVLLVLAAIAFAPPQRLFLS